MKLGLGTVQFGLDYGVSNRGAKTPLSEVVRILRLAASSGIRVLDTAAGYGESETVLGCSLPEQHDFAIVTKTPTLRADAIDDHHIERVRESFQRSLTLLKQDSLYCLLVHRAEDLLSTQGERLMQTLLEFKHQGLIQKVGVSVYNAAQIDAVLARHPLDLVQLPVNVFDQRLIGSGHLAKLKRAGIEIHVRSVFLQGLLLMPQDAVPAYFAPIRGHLAKYREFQKSAGLTTLQASLGFVMSVPEMDHVIVGVNTAEQLQEILAVGTVPVDAQFMAQFALTDPAMLEPWLWKLA